MTTTGGQFTLASSTGAVHSGSNSIAEVEVKPNIVVVTAPSTNSTSTIAQSQSTRNQQIITVVTSPNSSNTSNLQPIQVLMILI